MSQCRACTYVRTYVFTYLCVYYIYIFMNAYHTFSYISMYTILQNGVRAFGRHNGVASHSYNNNYGKSSSHAVLPT